MIRSFADKRAAAIFAGHTVRGIPNDIQVRVQAKLEMINAAARLGDLRLPPGNRLKALKGDRHGQHSIRINHQWRICFRWSDGEVLGVEITDYH
ncbi:MAG: type II toxin-antitoxin system RelE/ParE family toxin [Gemmatimonadota bacterium]|nr:type II toxin-antitoxin system RelE/ParE family toxin [Gemmatimonadota bacterium]MDE2863553.1 type II toxin-antitoxin system RelE/ParE family toxin [Gemmatimonadota bacterium]